MSDLDNSLLSYEIPLWDRGLSCVVGIDEVGRGPLAGPVVVAAVSFPQNSLPPLVDDSKKLTESKREKLYDEIVSFPGIKYSIVEKDSLFVDKYNILQATHIAMREAAMNITNVEFALIDGLPVKNFPVPSEAIVKGDSKSASIAAASILAKVYRDRLMIDYAKKYPGYGFENNKGYGTKQHLAAIKDIGITPIHRRSFAPVKDILNPPPVQTEFNF